MFKQSMRRRLQRRKANAKYRLNHPDRVAKINDAYRKKNINDIKVVARMYAQILRLAFPHRAKTIELRHYTSQTKQDWLARNKERLKHYKKEWLSNKNNNVSNNASKNNWKRKNRHKTKCHKMVQMAIKSGVLIRLNCQECGHNNTQAHHADYSKPLEVIWLCETHHKQVHRKYPITDTLRLAYLGPSHRRG